MTTQTTTTNEAKAKVQFLMTVMMQASNATESQMNSLRNDIRRAIFSLKIAQVREVIASL